jgi:hypothetical protein
MKSGMSVFLPYPVGASGGIAQDPRHQRYELNDQHSVTEMGGGFREAFAIGEPILEVREGYVPLTSFDNLASEIEPAAIYPTIAIGSYLIDLSLFDRIDPNFFSKDRNSSRNMDERCAVKFMQ